MSKSIGSALLAACVGVLCSAAAAQTSLPPVGISAHRTPPALPRVDVSTVCPSYGQQLADTLSLPPVERPVDMIVRFQLSGGAMQYVDLRRASWDNSIRNEIRRAMHRVSCADDGQTNQSFAFILRVVPESEGGTEVAALSPDSPLLLALAKD